MSDGSFFVLLLDNYLYLDMDDFGFEIIGKE
jgi:hypothetical protein